VELLGVKGRVCIQQCVVSCVNGLTDGQVAMADYETSGDSALGEVSYEGSGSVSSWYPLYGVRADSAVLLGGQPSVSGLATRDSIPLVLLRVDDVPTSDLDFLPRLAARGLVAEIAVPTGFVGLPNRLTWEQIGYWARRGFGIAAHSRTHAATTSAGVDFAAEVVGSFQDLSDHGLVTRVFVQPGNWPDSLYINTTRKLHNWRGALLRTCARVFEAYAHEAVQRQPLVDSVASGLSHLTISDGGSRETILSDWQRATQPYSVTVFMVHSSRLQSPDELDWFLDSLGVATARGRVRVVSSSDYLFAN